MLALATSHTGIKGFIRAFSPGVALNIVIIVWTGPAALLVYGRRPRRDRVVVRSAIIVELRKY